MSAKKKPAHEEQPAGGGSYVRNRDGSLTRVEATEHSDGPVAVADEADAPAAPEPAPADPVVPVADVQQEG